MLQNFWLDHGKSKGRIEMRIVTAEAVQAMELKGFLALKIDLLSADCLTRYH
jgi:hypothetical protein